MKKKKCKVLPHILHFVVLPALLIVGYYHVIFFALEYTVNKLRNEEKMLTFSIC